MSNRWNPQGTTTSYNQFAIPKGDDKGVNKVRDPLLTASRWFKRRSQKEKALLGSVVGLLVRPKTSLIAQSIATSAHLLSDCAVAGVDVAGYRRP